MVPGVRSLRIQSLCGDLWIQMLCPRKKLWHLHQIRARWSSGSCHIQHCLYHIVQVFAVVFRQLLILAFQDTLEQALHVICLKRWLERDHFINNAPKGPDIALEIVWLVAPHLRTGVVGSARLRVVQSTLIGQLGYVHVTKFASPVFVDEDIG